MFETLYMVQAPEIFKVEQNCDYQDDMLLQLGIGPDIFKLIREMLPFQCSLCLQQFGLKGNWALEMIGHFKTNHLKEFIADKDVKMEPQESLELECQTQDGEAQISENNFETRESEKIFIDRGTKAKENLFRNNRKEIITSCNPDLSSINIVSCNKCGSKFANEVFLKEHHNEKTIWNCEECNQNFCSNMLLFIHNYKKHGIADDGNFIVCEVCLKIVKKKAFAKHNVTKHMNGHSSKTQDKFTCPYCNFVFKRKSILNNHLLKHGEPRFSCEICGKMFHQQRNRRCHIQTLHKVTYTCDICGMGLGSDHDLKVHSEKHKNEEKEFRCLECNQKFCSKNSLKTHIMSKHSGQKPFKCNECEKCFAIKRGLSDHIKRVHRFKGLIKGTCDVCGKSFTGVNGLANHKKIHLGIRNFKCELCGKTFMGKGNLTTHMIVHTGEKPFECNLCGARFTQSSSLKDHKLIHYGVKNFTCSLCGLKFYKECRLRRHMNTHSGERHYHCKPCSKSYTNSSSLSKHNKSVHGVKKGDKILLNTILN